MRYIRRFDAIGREDLELAGGKGANLGELVKAGLPVPPGFVLTTEAYDDFVAAGGLRERILELAQTAMSDDGRSAGDAAEAIEGRFLAAEMPAGIRDAIETAYVALEERVGRDAMTEWDVAADEARSESGGNAPLAVAVRSSATAEDLPGASFAGQQETYLSVRGPEASARAVKRCWASLWTARAMSYRQSQGIAPEGVSLAVVVQAMVPAEVSGILFTANPSTGERNRMLISASFGLGQAIVGGEVEPDHMVVDRTSGELVESRVGAKHVRVVPAADQGVETREVTEDERSQAALDEATLRELVALGERIEAHFGTPQDIEWALGGGRVQILQARPITSLPPEPLQDIVWEPTRPGGRLIRRQIVEHMPGPLSPLFDDLYLGESMDLSIENFLAGFGMEDFDISAFYPKPFFLTVHGYAYSRTEYQFPSLWAFVKAVVAILPAYLKMLPVLLKHAVARWRDEKLPAYRDVIDRWAELDRRAASDEDLMTGIRELTAADAIYWFEVSIILGLSKVSDDLLDRFVRKLDGERELSSALFLRGFSSEPLEAQASLEAIARRIGRSDALRTRVLEVPPGRILDELRDWAEADGEAKGIVEAIDAHIERYGHQVYTLDFAEPTQGEDKLPILVGLAALLRAPADSRSRRADMAAERDRLVEQTAASLRPLRRWRFRKQLDWAQRFAPHRESALFYVGAAWPVLRKLAAELGRRMVDAGVIDAVDDIYFLRAAELDAAIEDRAAGRPPADHREAARERRLLRERRQRLDPPHKIPDVPFTFGPINLSAFETQKRDQDEAGGLSGFGVSPGRVTAPAAVLRSPADFEKMRPGHILVCPTTTPAWTPLFGQAAGLVTEIGSILAHGSIVAREYGIPAVLGLEGITGRIRDGQRITVDGDRGLVTIEEEEA